jgi:hypothetical protein
VERDQARNIGTGAAKSNDKSLEKLQFGFLSSYPSHHCMGGNFISCGYNWIT